VDSTKILIIRATVFYKDNAADLLLQKVTQYAKKLQRNRAYSKMFNLCQTSVHSQAHSGNCALALKKIHSCVERSLNRNF